MQVFRLFAGLLLAVPVFAQSSMTGANWSSNNAGWSGTAHFAPRPLFGALVTGAPYSAQHVSEHVQTTADGTRFTTNNQQETIYRDSQGRTRTERKMTSGPNAADAPLIVEISDPVANVGYILDLENKVAHRFTYPAAPAQQRAMAAVPAGVIGGGGGSRSGTFSGSIAPPPTAAARPRAESSQVDLGTQMIEGVLAKGQRFVQTWPVGSQGNDRPFQTTSENWMSAELKLAVLTKSVDPRTGENSMKLLEISRLDPSPMLFLPPPDYTVVDESGPFDIHWTGGPRQ
jgi:hypothetical protein